MVAPIDISIRRARPSDKRAVNEICRHIWGGNDYVPEVFEEWVRDRRGGLWLATIGGRPVGVAKLTLLGDREAWLHALRVHPRFRRRGIARALIAHRLERAKALGARIARLDTSEDNLPVRRLMRRFGFRRIGRYTLWTARARKGDAPRPATQRDLPSLYRLARQGDGLLHELFVRRRIGDREIARDVRAGRCYVVGANGRPGAMAMVERYEDRLRLRHIAGSGRDLHALLHALPALAALRKKPRVGITVSSLHWDALRSSGYRKKWPDSMLLFEKRL